MIGYYQWSGGSEAMLRFGPETGPVMLMALPLFEEANRTRAFAVRILRELAVRGIAGALPDLPGQGESMLPLESLSLERIQQGFAGAADHLAKEGRGVFAAAIRSGALLDRLAPVQGRWHFAPQDGADMLRELKRVKQVELGYARLSEDWYLEGVTGMDDGLGATVEIAGNRVSAGLLASLAVATASDKCDRPRRVTRLENDAKSADAKFPGTPLWRRAQPENDPALAALLADDIAQWVRTCAG